MNKSRLEAFSDGVIAIIITIMVLEFKTPHEVSLEAIKPLVPIFISYVISFIVVGIYWGNHHYLIHTLARINGKIIWANMHLLFWLSLIPFATAWMGETSFSKYSVMLYAALLNICGVAYYILLLLVSKNIFNDQNMMKSIVRQKRKGVFSLISYTIAIVTALFNSVIAAVIIALVAAIWFIPDKSIEKIEI